MLVFNNYFCKNRKLKLYFRDRVAVLNHLLCQIEGSTVFSYFDLRLTLLGVES
jgi:hypothetical protein